MTIGTYLKGKIEIKTKSFAFNNYFFLLYSFFLTNQSIQEPCHSVIIILVFSKKNVKTKLNCGSLHTVHHITTAQANIRKYVKNPESLKDENKMLSHANQFRSDGIDVDDAVGWITK